jgi:RND family efflux transporter MFP subunit
MKRQLWIIAVLLAVTGALVVVSGAGHSLQPPNQGAAPAGERSPSEGPAPMVRTAVLSAPSARQSRQFFGQVRARETVDLALQVGGTLERLIPEEGMRVARGETLARLRLDPFERAVARAELQRDMARREAERARDLADRAVGPLTRAEDAETARDLAEVALRDARAALEDAVLTAPFDGLVAARLVAEHSSVAAGQPVLRLHDMSQVRVDLSLPERLFAAAGGLEQVRFTAALFGEEVALDVVAFQPEASRVGQSFRVTLSVPAGAAAGLVPGASLTVLASVPMPAAGLAVPAEAVLTANDRSTSVFVVEGAEDDLRVRQVPVQVTTPDGTTLQVVGVPEGAEIVTAGVHRLQDGQRVRRFAALTFVEG